MNKLIKVLLVEDDEDDYVLAKGLFSDIKNTVFDITWESEYTKALKAIVSNHFDIHLLDYRLGQHNGVQLLNQAITKGAKNPIILLTGEGDLELDVQAMKAGAADYLVKGQITPALLERSIRFALERQRVEFERDQRDKEKVARIEAEAREQYYRILSEAIPHIVWTMEPDGQMDYINNRWTEYTGITLKESQGTGWTKAMHPDDIAASEQIWINALKKAESYEMEYRLRNAQDGTYRWFLGRTVPIFDETGKLIKWFGTGTDIEDQRRAVDALTFLNEAGNILGSSLNYKKTLENIAAVAVPAIADWFTIDMLDEQGELSQIALTHRDPKKIKWGKELREQYPVNLQEEGGVAHVLRTGESVFFPLITDEMLLASINDEKQLELVRKVGFTSVIMVPLISQNRPIGAMSLITAESGRRYDETDLVMAKSLGHRISLALDNATLYEQSQEGIRVRDEFLNIAAHELKTPLTSLQLQTQLLMKQIAKDTNQKALEPYQKMLRSGTEQLARLGKLINNLLDVSKISNKKLELDRESVDLSKITEEVIHRFDEQIKTKGSKLIFNNSVHITGEWDKFRIDQVLTNLISNAIKYGEGKPITVSLIKQGNHGIIKIADQGIGIAPKDSQRIFNRFERTDTAQKYGGLGLGLYIVKEIIEAHGGEISVESEPDKGSTFTVQLPLSSPTP